MQNDNLYRLLMDHKNVCYFISERGLKWPKLRNVAYLEGIFNTCNNKTNVQNTVGQAIYCAKKYNVSTHAFKICTCLTFSCGHAVVL